MEEFSLGLMQLGFGAFGLLAVVCAGCLSALAVASTKKALRDLR
jgi:hypothetical protein